MGRPKTVLVTGASSGIGKATAKLLAADGNVVFGTSRFRRRNNHKFRMLKFDANSDSSADECISEFLKEAGHIDVLVNNAGTMSIGAIEEFSIAAAKRQFEANFFGVARMVKAVLPHMRRQRHGSIINVGSLAGTFPVPFEGYYSASKAALYAYSEALHNELKEFNIRVSVVEPGFFKTRILDNSNLADRRLACYNETKGRVISKMHYATENGQDPHLVAEAIVGIVESTRPNFRYVVGYQGRYLKFKRVIPDEVMVYFLRKYWMGK